MNPNDIFQALENATPEERQALEQTLLALLTGSALPQSASEATKQKALNDIDALEQLTTGDKISSEISNRVSHAFTSFAVISVGGDFTKLTAIPDDAQRKFRAHAMDLVIRSLMGEILHMCQRYSEITDGQTMSALDLSKLAPYATQAPAQDVGA